MSMGGGSNSGLSSAASTQTAISKEAAGNINEITDTTMDFTQSFFKDYIQPAVAKLGGVVDTALGRNEQLFGQAQAIATGREADYQANKGAVNQYLQDVAGRDVTAEGQAAAGLAIGDVKAAGANAAAQQERALEARGINPTSGMAVAGARSAGLNTALVAASEANRARRLAQESVRGAKAGAAQFVQGQGNLSTGLPSQYAGLAGQGVGLAGAGISAVGEGANPVLKGYETAGGLQVGLNKSASAAATDLQIQDAKSKDASAGGLGNLVGTLGGAVLKAYLPVPKVG